jgi:hypothetical protein
MNNKCVYAEVGTDARRAAVVRTGRDPGSVVELDLAELPESDRAIIAAEAVPTSNASDAGLRVEAKGARDTTAEAVAEYLRARQAQRAEEARKDQQEREQREREAREHAAAAVADPDTRWTGGYCDYPCPEGYDSEYRSYRAAYDAVPGVKECRERARQKREQARAAAEAAAKAAEAARQAAKRQERETWIQEHGSEQLRLLLAGGYELEAVYASERIAAEMPGWCEDLQDLSELRVCQPVDPITPPLEALRAAAEDPESRLQYAATYATSDEGQIRAGGIYLLERVHAPTGRWVYRLATPAAASGKESS